MQQTVRITEVGLRDGLQNERPLVPTSDKIALGRSLLACGFDEIEVTSFVSPKWIPQLADAADVLLGLAPHCDDRTMISALVPNEQGMRKLLDVRQKCVDAAGKGMIDKVSVFAAASETFSRRNTNGSIAEVIERFRPVVALAKEHQLAVRGYVSCVIQCPFEGPIAPTQVAHVVRMLLDLEVDEIDLGDTLGVAHPEEIVLLLREVGVHPAGRTGAPRLVTLHLHDTFGRAADCVLAALGEGVRSFDASVAGLGGCPYASTPERAAPGNIDTTLLVETAQRAGYVTGVDLNALHVATGQARDIVHKARLNHAEGATP